MVYRGNNTLRIEEDCGYVIPKDTWTKKEGKVRELERSVLIARGIVEEEEEVEVEGGDSSDNIEEKTTPIAPLRQKNDIRPLSTKNGPLEFIVSA